MIAWLQLLRWKNLIIIIATQFLLYWTSFKEYTPEGNISLYYVLLLILCTIMVAGSGFIINDLFDLKTDFINRPRHQWLIGIYFSLNDTIYAYYALVIVGGLIAMFLSIRLEFYYSYLFYPFSIYLFWLYSKFLKCSCFWGNILISIFISSVVLIIPYLFYEKIQYWRSTDYERYSDVVQKIIQLSVFAFGMNFFREIIKDIEDEYGDRKTYCSTAPVVFGIEKCRMIAQVVLIAVILWGLYSCFILVKKNPLIYTTLIILPPIIIFLKLLKKTTIDYENITKLAKWYMLTGMLYLSIM